MKSIELSVKDASSALNIVGAVFPTGAPDNSPPLVSHVIARLSFSTRFALGPGEYSYIFHVEGTGGAFTVEIEQDGEDEPLASKGLDTKDGFYHRVVRFRVRA
jgi:hypothetical protein